MSRTFLFFFFLTVLSACASYRYVDIETYNAAAITFPPEMRRFLIVNNALPQDEVPFETTYDQLPDTIIISADSAAYDFCRTLGEVLAEFQHFDDVRLLEGCLRRDMSPLDAPLIPRNEVELLCEEHETDIIISLDRLLFRLNEHAGVLYGFRMKKVIDIELTGILRVYVPGRDTYLTSILLNDTITPELWFDYNETDIREFLFPPDEPDILRQSAIFVANQVSKNFAPYWNKDIRWYYTSPDSRWKEATAYTDFEKWDKALEIWTELYRRTTAWKQRARLCSNLALTLEMTGDMEQALKYAKESHQLMHDHLGADNVITKKQEVYVNVLTSRITDEQKLRLQVQ